jgi:DNA-binding CsgD family transcriptional regulator
MRNRTHLTLTERERQVLALERSGISRKRISEITGIKYGYVGGLVAIAADKERAFNLDQLDRRGYGMTSLKKAHGYPVLDRG